MENDEKEPAVRITADYAAIFEQLKPPHRISDMAQRVWIALLEMEDDALLNLADGEDGDLLEFAEFCCGTSVTWINFIKDKLHHELSSRLSGFTLEQRKKSIPFHRNK